MTKTWDYLIVTAANQQQAKAYDFQLRERLEAGEIQRVRNCMVVADTDGRRIGSGGSTLNCLHRVLAQQGPNGGGGSFEEAGIILSKLRILIVHAGGDSRRLPAYSHCGKMFVPLPEKGRPSSATTLFDRLVPAFLSLPEATEGQVVVASGDALILFDGSAVDFSRRGITALGSPAPPGEAAHHGVFCADDAGSVRRFLQKPSPQAQARSGAVNEDGNAVLDLGVMSFDADAAVQLMRAFFEPGLGASSNPGLVWKERARPALLTHGIDLYREICCALGTDTTLEDYLESVRASGSTVDPSLLAEWFDFLCAISLHLVTLPSCKFLHFGTTRQLITSGIALLEEDQQGPWPTSLILNSEVQLEPAGDHAWVEGCSVSDELTLEGFNAIVGVDVVEPLTLRKSECMGISPGFDRNGRKVWFLMYYGIDDTFKHSAEEGGTFCGLPLAEWLTGLGAAAFDIWSPDTPEPQQTLWNARVFPALEDPLGFRQWLWLFEAGSATQEQRNRFFEVDRYSCSEIALRVDQSEFYNRRLKFRSSAGRDETRAPIRAEADVVKMIVESA